MSDTRRFPWPVAGLVIVAVILSFQASKAQPMTKPSKKPVPGAAAEKPATPADSVYTDIWTAEVIPIPKPKGETITPEPGPGYVWIPGYWERSPDTWDWISGHWAKPPDKKAHWVNGYWQWDEGKWHWMAGHWAVSNVGAGMFVEQPVAIPALLNEPRPPKPDNTNRWVPGYWEWDGTWFWMPGYWSAKSDVDANWVSAGWTAAGDLGYKWTAGHWTVK
jgi:hypothetical protein